MRSGSLCIFVFYIETLTSFQQPNSLPDGEKSNITLFLMQSSLVSIDVRISDAIHSFSVTEQTGLCVMKERNFRMPRRIKDA